MPQPRSALRLVMLALLAMISVLPVRAAGTSYQTGFTRWRAADRAFNAWHGSGVRIAADGSLQLDPSSAAPENDPYPPGGYYGGNFYTGGAYLVGEATSPLVSSRFNFREAIASWNALTPAGTWIEVLARAELGGRFTKWYNLGVWASDSSTVTRHSVRLQGDSDGFVSVDTLVLSNKKATAKGVQLKVRLFSTNASNAVPQVRAAAVATSTSPTKPGKLSPGTPRAAKLIFNLPQCSQMVYPDGGEVWCSPTSTSMVLGYWSGAPGPCEPRVRAAVEGVYDRIYDGHGNWPFNTAYAATHGMEGYVARFTSMAQLEPWLEAGVPAVISFAWNKGDLDGAAISSSNGHLAVLVGFDTAGNPVVNDPAAASDAEVQRTYDRAQLEALWLEHSGGTAYLIYPEGSVSLTP